MIAARFILWVLFAAWCGRVSSGYLGGYGTPWALPWADAGEDERAFIFGVNDLNQYTSMEIEGDAAPPFQATLAYDAAGNMISDGRYYYQYDAWNRVVQINRLAEVESFAAGGGAGGSGSGTGTPIEPSALLIKHYTYDGVGRLVRTQSPFPSPEDSTGEVRSERFYYDGIRRIQELVIDPVLSLGEALTSGDPELEQVAGGLTQQAGEPLDPSTTPGELEETQLQNLENPPTGGSPIPTSATLAREYVWGPGDGVGGGLDELLVQFGADRTRWWVIQDGGGDVVAVCDVGMGTAPIADIAGQWVYDAYGEVLVADHLLPFPQMHLGHKGIFIDRLDVAVVDSSGNESPRLVPFGHTICHNRNRLYSPQLGRFFQLDPNATAMALLVTAAYHGQSIGRPAFGFDVEALYADGMSIYEYTQSNPVTNSDPLGLFVGMLSIGCPGPGDMITGVLESLVTGYAQNMMFDVEWALDWSIPDDDFSRTDNGWIAFAIAEGLHKSFEIGVPFTEIGFNPLDRFAGGKSKKKSDGPDAGGGGKKKRGGETVHTVRGKDKHREYRAKKEAEGCRTEFPVPGGRIDALDENKRVIYELKPNSPSGRYKGLKQLQRYKEAMEQKTGKKWKTQLDLYDVE
ncbi:MAG: hypothetical protein KF912_10440 [Phycisphaeraceae bacterium]|nr:hypothetical protein [Phycisphaeraceae bacterium]MBX3367716.1 hypothetical protein [Phycisphaeraceae bacterium]